MDRPGVGREGGLNTGAPLCTHLPSLQLDPPWESPGQMGFLYWLLLFCFSGLWFLPAPFDCWHTSVYFFNFVKPYWDVINMQNCTHLMYTWWWIWIHTYTRDIFRCTKICLNLFSANVPLVFFCSSDFISPYYHIVILVGTQKGRRKTLYAQLIIWNR